ncbi:MAG: VOC family protein [Spirochaetaceae bacterium]|nr:VOC family protein [Myxococcales bacterium]MCB9726249.1 VOC family protein [Spirochaetaceae bacterium]
MVGYTTFGTNDLEKAKAFYDALLGEFGAKRIMDTGRLVLWGRELGNGMFAICTPYDKEKATPGNGAMVAFNMESRANVDKLHAKALSLGASDEGAPGERGPGFYGAYFRDADGNKFCGFCMG